MSVHSHGYNETHLERIAFKFRVGGYVTVYEADAHMTLARGETLKAVNKGLIPSRLSERGKHTRIIVRTQDVEAVLGVKAQDIQAVLRGKEKALTP